MLKINSSLIAVSLCSLLASTLGLAQVISPSSTEVNASYEARFFVSSAVANEDEAVELAGSHSQYLFGIFHSPSMVERYGIQEDTGGVAAPRMPFSIDILATQTKRGGTEISYRATTKILVNKRAATKWVREGSVTLPLPYNISEFYDKKCTDEHYDSEGDFWYFYDPFRRGCEYLGREPVALPTHIEITPDRSQPRQTTPRLDLLRGDNGNGDTFHIVTVNGFSEDSKAEEDEGRQAFGFTNETLREWGFEETAKRINTTRPLHTFQKTVRTGSGRSITIKIERLLAETAIDSRNVTFAKFFKDSLQNADVIIYGGHSGLGGNLDIDLLEQKAGAFTFTPGKKQILFFDSCSSYSYYLDSFKNKIGRGNVDIMTQGLSSYFETGHLVLEALLTTLLDVDNNPNWQEVLTAMEEPLEGDTYMLNVGAL